MKRKRNEKGRERGWIIIKTNGVQRDGRDRRKEELWREEIEERRREKRNRGKEERGKEKIMVGVELGWEKGDRG